MKPERWYDRDASDVLTLLTVMLFLGAIAAWAGVNLP
jgi:hypothetical protein